MSNPKEDLETRVARVYSHITGGRITDPNASVEQVIEAATAHDNDVLGQVLQDEKEKWLNEACVYGHDYKVGVGN